MRDDIIDTVNAEDVQVGDFINEGEVIRVEPHDEKGDLIDIEVDGEGTFYFDWDERVNLYGSLSVEI